MADDAAQRDERLTDEEFRAVCRHLDVMVRAFENLPFPEVRDQVFDLLRMVDALHRDGIGRLVDSLRDAGQGPVIDRAAEDVAVGTLLTLYDLVPGALDSPAETGTAGRPVAGAPHFIPLSQIAPSRPARGSGFRELASLEDVPIGTMTKVDAGEMPVLLANVDGEVYAVRNCCPGSVAPLSLGFFTPPVVICPWHNEAFDVRTGERADGGTGPGLDVLPVSVRDGAILVALDPVPLRLERRVP